MLVPRINNYHHRIVRVVPHSNGTITFYADDGITLSFSMVHPVSQRLLALFLERMGITPQTIRDSSELVGLRIPAEDYLRWKKLGQDRQGRQLFK